ncbi:MAG: hypothetical protein RBT76_15395 [candidate division Zixibacteria bacterium]|jgi:hypothetical protein|nr:hypothetical protein [candidate division Zixibacteria bacterium]
MTVWERIAAMDRRWIYLMCGIAVLVPFIIPVSLPVYTTPEVQQLYDAVNSLPDSSIVMLTYDYYPSTVAETEPMSRAALHHLFSKNCKVVTLSNIPLGGPTIAERVTRELAAEYGKVYGVDYVNLGYKANYVAVMKGLGTAISGIFPTDNTGTPLTQLPLMQSVRNYEDIAFIFVVADNATADYWVSIVNAQYGVPMCCGATAVMAPKLYAFVGSGQLQGLLGGMKGAAEYEQLLGRKDRAVRGMDAQSLIHLLIIVLVAIGNLGYFMGRRAKRGERA